MGDVLHELRQLATAADQLFEDGGRFEAGGFSGSREKLAHGQVFQKKFMYRKPVFLYKCTFKHA